MSQNFTYQNNNQAQSTFGLSSNVASLVSYLFIPVTSIIFVVTEKEDRLVRFHAWQSLFYGLSLTVMTVILGIVIGVVSFVVSSISPVAGFLVTLVSLLLWIVLAIAILISWVVCLIKAWQGKFFKLPIVGRIAESMTNK